MQKIKQLFVFLFLSLFLVCTCLLPAAQAQVISTHSYLATADAPGDQVRLESLLDQESVRAQLIDMGVDPSAVEARLAHLTPEEQLQLQQRLAELPAGAGALEIIGAVFLVLLILELVGVTNIFNKI